MNEKPEAKEQEDIKLKATDDVLESGQDGSRDAPPKLVVESKPAESIGELPRASSASWFKHLMEIDPDLTIALPPYLVSYLCETEISKEELFNTFAARLIDTNIGIGNHGFEVDSRERRYIDLAKVFGPSAVFILILFSTALIWFSLRDPFYIFGPHSGVFYLVGLIPLLAMSVCGLIPIARMLLNRNEFILAGACLKICNKFRTGTIGRRNLYQRALAEYFGIIGRPIDAQAIWQKLALPSQSAFEEGDRVRKRELPTDTAVLIAQSALNSILLKNLDQARSELEEALSFLEEASKNHSLTHDSAGYVLYVLGRFHEATGYTREAFECFERALRVRLSKFEVIPGALLETAMRMGDEWVEAAFQVVEHGTPLRDDIKVNIYASSAEPDIWQFNMDSAEKKLLRAESILKRIKVDPDIGRVYYLLAEVNSRLEDYQAAQEYNSSALKVRRSALPKGHQKIRETILQRVKILKHLDASWATQLAEFELELSDPSGKPAEPTGLDQDKTLIAKLPPSTAGVRRQKILMGILFTTCLGFGWPLVAEGFRAASGLALFSGTCMLTLLSVFIWSRLHELMISSGGATIWKALFKRRDIMTDVTVVQAPAKNSGKPYLVEIGAPFSTRRNVPESLFMEQLCLRGRCRAAKIRSIDGIPTGLETAQGWLALTVPGETKKSLRKNRANRYLIFGILASWIGLSFVASTHSPRENLPPGLTAYEYWRLGATNIAVPAHNFDYFSELDMARQALNKAASLDQGWIGQAASNCLRSELPNKEIDEETKRLYCKGMSPDTDIDEAEDCLRQVRERDPQFEWAYSQAAELRLLQHDLTGAASLLEKAKVLNPQSMSYLLARAKLERAQNQYESALATINQTLAIDPFYEPARATLLEIIGKTVSER